jgi:hypothetical protein
MRRTCATILVAASLIAGAAGAFADPPTPAVAVPGSYGPTPAAVSCGEARYPYDAPEPWLHGYFQETPAYAGFHAFRPYNYKHIFAQSQLAADWGMSATAPYSHQSSRTQAK